MRVRKLVLAGIVFGLGLGHVVPVIGAEKYPAKPITVVIPFFTRPIAAVFLALTLLLILAPYLMKKLFGFQYSGG